MDFTIRYKQAACIAEEAPQQTLVQTKCQEQMVNKKITKEKWY